MSKKKAKKVNVQIKEINAPEVTAIAIEEPKTQEWDNGFSYKAKTMFKAQSIETGRIFDFVVWKNFNIKKGDTFHSIGKVEESGKAFIGWADLTKIIKRA